jgi:hypothetical protein
MMAGLEIPQTSLLLHPDFMDEKETLKKYLNMAIEKIVMANQKKDEPYFIIFHEKSDAKNSRQKIRCSKYLPGFITNTIVFWVCNKRGICEWLWTVPPKVEGKKLRVEFNTQGVAYLQAKGAMPS